jgi:hypothetical protein
MGGNKNTPSADCAWNRMKKKASVEERVKK